jgi:hypothetical protein
MKQLVLWKDKQDWPTLTQTNQKEEKTQISTIRDEKGYRYNWNPKDN